MKEQYSEDTQSPVSLLSWIPNHEEGQSIVKKMPEKFKTGEIWLDSEDWQVYLQIYVLAVIFFFLMYFLFDRVFKVL